MNKIVKDIAGAPIPTPVVLLTTVSADGKANIITLAWVGVACSDPLILSAGIRPPRHSHHLLQESGEAVVNVPTADILRQTDQCGMVSGRDADKFAAYGLTPIAADLVKPPLIAECPVNLETKVTTVHSLGTHDLFLLEVVRTHVDESLLDDSGRFAPAAAVFFSYMGTSYLAHAGVIGHYGYSKK